MMSRIRSELNWCRNKVATLVLVSPILLGVITAASIACGGFFCQLVPIDQAGEQIIFSQDGDRVTAVVQIQYTGEASDFSWVVPVPGIPDLSVGSDLVFQPLEQATRPQFNLLVEGEECFDPTISFGGGIFASPLAENVDVDAADDGVEILQRQSVGPFETLVVSSEDPQALATWLDDNGYDLSDRGAELVAPYVEEGMNFIALKLRQDQGVGDLQPLIMRYTSARAMIPIRLTAVAATPDMGIIAWILGDARAVPMNYLSVEPNLTRLDWYSGTFNAYASYQSLVTEAMDEAGGQGFATDFAGPNPDLSGTIPDAGTLREEIIALRALSDSEFYPSLFFNFILPQTKVLEILRRELPLPVEGIDESNYAEFALLSALFDEPTLTAARESILTELTDTVVVPLEETLEVLGAQPFMTRLYTTLSPEEMTLDPMFSFNRDIPEQPLAREATLNLNCVAGETQWTLELGAGTGRDGEVVIRGIGPSPLFRSPPVIDQFAVSTSAMVSDEGEPQFVTKNTFAEAVVRTASTGDIVEVPNVITDIITMCGNGILGASFLSLATLTLVSFTQRRRTRNEH